MVDISIAYDRLRLEEKMLSKKVAELGHTASMIDAKAIRTGTSSTKESLGIGDVMLERCVSYYRGMFLTAIAEFAGASVINSLKVAANCGNKLFMTLLLKKAGVPTPETYFSLSAQSARERISEAGRPLVIKPLVGSWGRGVMRINDADAIDAVIEAREITDSGYDRTYYFQELVDRPPRDIRVITVGDQAVGAMYRSSDGFRTNVAAGATPEACEITGEMRELAARASGAVGGGILGVDMMEDRERGLVVHEVNNTVEFRGLASTGQADIPQSMVEFALRSAKR